MKTIRQQLLDIARSLRLIAKEMQGKRTIGPKGRPPHKGRVYATVTAKEKK